VKSCPILAGLFREHVADGFFMHSGNGHQLQARQYAIMCICVALQTAIVACGTNVCCNISVYTHRLELDAGACVQVGSVEIEQIIVLHVPEVQQAAAIAIPPPTGGPEQLALFVVPKDESSSITDKALLQTITANSKQAIRAHLNPLFKLQQVVLVKTLPRNASNKVMRRVLREEAQKLAAAAGAAPVSKL
jgi:AMP-binding enzyme C-terminal domain